MSDSPVVSIENVWFSYDGPPVLEDVHLAVEERDCACMVGPNGGGKTTLLKIMLGLLKPAKGEVRVFGKAPEEVRSRIGYVPQHAQFDPCFPIRVMDVALMGRLGGARGFGPYSKRDKEAAREALRQVDLENQRDGPFFSLSGGQRQRVLIARALVGEPELILLDEPTANLDLSVEGEFHELLRQLNQRLTVVLVSHDIGFVSHLVNRLFCVNRKVLSHTTSEVTPEILQEIYGEGHHVVQHDTRLDPKGRGDRGG